MRFVYTLIFTVFIYSFGIAQSTDLMLNLEEGQVYRQRTSSTATINQNISGQEINMVMTINGTMSFLVKSQTAAGYELETSFNSLSMSMEMPQGKLEFSSENADSTDVFSTILSAMKEKSFLTIMDKKGKVSEVRNVESLWDNAINNFEQIPPMQREQIKAQIMKAYGAEALKGNMEMVTSIYPEKPVQIGDKWNVVTNLESGISAIMTTEYELVTIADDYVQIGGSSVIQTADKDAYVETNGMPLKYDMKGSMVSEIKVDKSTGWIREAKISQEISGDAYIKGNSQMPEGLKIPMVMKNELLITNQ